MKNKPTKVAARAIEALWTIGNLYTKANVRCVAPFYFDGKIWVVPVHAGNGDQIEYRDGDFRDGTGRTVKVLGGAL